MTELNEDGKQDKYSDIDRENILEYEGNDDSCCSWRIWNISQSTAKEPRCTGVYIKNWTRSDHSIGKLVWNTLKTPGYLRKVAVI